MIYLDNNATTPTSPQVAEAMAAILRQQLANPASPHRVGRDARRLLESCRDQIAVRLGAETTCTSSDRVIFTSGGTEANNLALLGSAAANSGQIVLSAIEHPSVSAAADMLAQQGRKVVRLPVDAQGQTSLDDLPGLLREPTAIVSLMWANNETGVLQPVVEAAVLCKESGTPFHTDAVQAVGKTPIAFRDAAVSALTCNAHKLHGPPGVGVLLLNPDCEIEPRLFGGFQQGGIRPGTESVGLAVGMRTAIDMACESLEENSQRLSQLRDQLESEVCSRLDEVVVVGRASQRTPHASCIAFPGLDRQELILALDMADVACSAGSACASGSSEPSATLLAMRLPNRIVEGALRFSVSVLNTEEEVAEAANRIVDTAKRMFASQSASARKASPTHDA